MAMAHQAAFIVTSSSCNVHRCAQTTGLALTISGRHVRGSMLCDCKVET